MDVTAPFLSLSCSTSSESTTDRAMTTTEFDESVFPYVFECMDCPHDSTVEVSHEEAVDAVPPGIEATVRQAVTRARRAKGWWIQAPHGLRCPDCVEDRE